MHLVRTTYANAALLDPDNESWQRYQFLSNNCAKLAAFLEGVPDEDHDQNSFVEIHIPISKDEFAKLDAPQVFKSCGTTACAMGWAALSHIIPGLQYVIQDDSAIYAQTDTAELDYNPTINGAEADWDDAADAFFGEHARETIFHQYGTKAHTIKLLYAEAERLCTIARGLKHKDPAVLDLLD